MYGWMASFDPRHSLYKEEQASKYPTLFTWKLSQKRYVTAQVTWGKVSIRQSEEI